MIFAFVFVVFSPTGRFGHGLSAKIQLTFALRLFATMKMLLISEPHSSTLRAVSLATAIGDRYHEARTMKTEDIVGLLCYRGSKR
ncbi:hypothetical protein ACP4OV_010205 [Aristida adscensionis]